MGCAAKLITDAEVERLLDLEHQAMVAKAQHDLLGFVLAMMPDYQVNWHHRRVAAVLMKFINGEINRLILAMPPQHGKSELFSRQMPAFMFGRDPNLRIVAASYASKVARRMNRDVQRIITSREYQQVFPGTAINQRNVRTMSKEGSWLRNSEMFEIVGARGSYMCAGLGGALTSFPADVALIDDPFRGWDQAYSATYRERAWEWYTSVLYTRLQGVGRIALTATRWHEDDLTGRLIAQMKRDPSADQFTIINFPAINEEGPNGLDPRQRGEALWPGRFPLEKLLKTRANSERVFVSLYQGAPAPVEGNIFKRDWWKFYRTKPALSQIDFLLLSADLTFKDREKGDWCVFQVWAKVGVDFYLMHQVRRQIGYVEQEDVYQAVRAEFATLNAAAIEDAANGAALVARMKKKFSNTYAVTVKGSKLSRAEAVAPIVRSGHAYIPDPVCCEWSQKFIEECAVFPNGKHDDQVDAMSLGLSEISKSTLNSGDWDFSLGSVEQVDRWEMAPEY